VQDFHAEVSVRVNDSGSEFHHLEVFLARAALGAGPVGRHVLPFRAWRDAFVRRTRGFVVDPAADEAHVLFHGRRVVGVKSTNSSKPGASRATVAAACPRCSREMTPDNDPEFPPLVLTFAASDPSCGAGLQADILTLASMGCHPLSVVTAITVQDTLGVEGIQSLDVEWVADQARCLLEDMPVDAFKIGVLGSVENIAAIAEIVSDYPDVPLILDPVLASGRARFCCFAWRADTAPTSAGRGGANCCGCWVPSRPAGVWVPIC